jgi:hypothetical protein
MALLGWTAPEYSPASRRGGGSSGETRSDISPVDILFATIPLLFLLNGVCGDTLAEPDPPSHYAALFETFQREHLFIIEAYQCFVSVLITSTHAG